MSSPEDGPVGPKHAEIRRYMNKIETVTTVGFSFLIEEFTSNSEVHSINTRNKPDLYPPSIKLTEYQKGVYYSGIKIFNHLPQNIKNLS